MDIKNSVKKGCFIQQLSGYFSVIQSTEGENIFFIVAYDGSNSLWHL